MLDAGVILFTCDGMRSDTVEMSTAITVAFKYCVQILRSQTPRMRKAPIRILWAIEGV
jgi:hypothetical protein